MNRVKLSMLVVCVITAMVTTFYVAGQKKQTPVSFISIINVEALAAEENEETIICLEEGSIDCKGAKVLYQYGHYRR